VSLYYLSYNKCFAFPIMYLPIENPLIVITEAAMTIKKSQTTNPRFQKFSRSNFLFLRAPFLAEITFMGRTKTVITIFLLIPAASASTTEHLFFINSNALGYQQFLYLWISRKQNYPLQFYIIPLQYSFR